MSKKVLIVEDDKNLAESLKNIFTKKKIEVKLSHSAPQAEHFVSLDKYDLLIVDVVLPRVNGIDFLKKIISQGLLDSHCKVWIISGVLSQHVISKEMKSHVDSFLKKPLNLQSVEKKIDSSFTTFRSLPGNMQFFYMAVEDKKNVLENKEYIIAGHELMFVWSYLSSFRFSGVLKINCHDVKEKDEILFKGGHIISFKSGDMNSYLGVLLVKNELVSKEDIKKLLSEKSDVPLGDRLVAGCYISPHHLHKILKEQLAIRLFEAMEHPLLTVNCVNFIPSVNFNYSASLEMNDLLSLVNNWMKSKVNKRWLKEFFSGCKDMYIKPLKKPSGAKYFSHYPGLGFLSSPTVQGEKTVADMINVMDKTEDKAIRELYCRILVKESCLEYKSDNAISNDNYDSIRVKYESFLKAADTKNYFELMNLPLNASLNKIEETYRDMVKIFHPDRRNRDMPEDLAKICDKCFILVGTIYKTLSNPQEKEKYLKTLENKIRMGSFAIKEMYMKGKKNLEEGLYTSAFRQFEFVVNSRLAPSDTILYYLWSKIKSAKSALNREEQHKIKELFDNVALECRHTATFYFVKGLFMKETGHKKPAFECFSKALSLDPKLKVARVEKHSLGAIQKKSLKSFMDIFKKGA